MALNVGCTTYLSVCVSVGFGSEVAILYKKPTETHSFE